MIDRIREGVFNGSYGRTVNGGNYRVRGAETSVAARIATGFTVTAGASWAHSELVKQARFLWADGSPIDFSTLRGPDGSQVQEPSGALGSPLSGGPAFEGNIRVRYEFAFNGYGTFAELGVVHQSHSLASTDRLSLDLQRNSVAYDLPAFTTYDAALGIGKEGWVVQAYGQNLSDKRAELFANYSQWYKGVTVNRPRTLGVRLSYKFGGS